MGYIMGKSEGKRDHWHGHVTAVTVAPTCRKLGLANQLSLGVAVVCIFGPYYDIKDRYLDANLPPTGRPRTHQ